MVESLLDDLLPGGDLKSDLISTKNDESRSNVKSERTADFISTKNDEIRSNINSERTADFISTKNDKSRSNVNNERADSKSDLIPTSNDEIRPKQRASINQEGSAKTKTKLEEKRAMKSDQNGINVKEVKIPLILKLSGYYGFKLNN